MNLRDDARDKPCAIRVPGYCCFDPSRTVLCHVRVSGISGMSMKAPDVIAAFGCQPCHDVVDGRTKTNFTASERRLMLLEGMARTQTQWVKREVLKW